MGLVDGATEIHKISLAHQLMRDVKPHDGLFPSYHLPALEAEARAKFAVELKELEDAEMTAEVELR
jgi:acyl-CoA dehydrogenase